jgi:hypothetical protein
VRMAKEMVQATGTDYLESADGATSQNWVYAVKEVEGKGGSQVKGWKYAYEHWTHH